MPSNSRQPQALQTVLSEWPLWGISGTRTPEIITQFRQGRSNDSYLLKIDTEHYVLRMRRVNHGQTQNTRYENLIQHGAAASPTSFGQVRRPAAMRTAVKLL